MRTRVEPDAIWRVRRRLRARAGDERAQAALEFALVLPLFLILILGIVQFGIVWNHYIQLTDATRAAGRAGTTCRFGGNPQTAFTNAGPPPGAYLDPFSCPANSGQQITITGHKAGDSITILGVTVWSDTLNSSITETVE